jgi:hypothetical protein
MGSLCSASHGGVTYEQVLCVGECKHVECGRKCMVGGGENSY